MLHQIKAPQFYTDSGLQKQCWILANGTIQGLFKAFECFSSTFQGKFHFQGLFKTVWYIQVLFKPVWTLNMFWLRFRKNKFHISHPLSGDLKLSPEKSSSMCLSLKTILFNCCGLLIIPYQTFDLARPHFLRASGEDHASTGVPPQLVSIRPIGFLIFWNRYFPYSQQTAENDVKFPEEEIITNQRIWRSSGDILITVEIDVRVTKT